MKEDNATETAAVPATTFKELIPNVKELLEERKTLGETRAEIEKAIEGLETRLSKCQESFAEVTAALALNNAERQKLLANGTNHAKIDATISALQTSLKNAGDEQEGLKDILEGKRAALESAEKRLREIDEQVKLYGLYVRYDEYNQAAEGLAGFVQKLWKYKAANHLRDGEIPEAVDFGRTGALALIPRLCVGGIYRGCAIKSVNERAFWDSSAADYFKD